MPILPYDIMNSAIHKFLFFMILRMLCLASLHTHDDLIYNMFIIGQGVDEAVNFGFLSPYNTMYLRCPIAIPFSSTYLVGYW